MDATDRTVRMLEGKSIVITGASSGIGAATARTLAAHGARLVLNARGEDALRQVVAELASGGADAIAVPGDVSDPATAQELVAVAIGAYGRLDGAFNNAGITQYGRLIDITPEDYDRLFEINVKGVWNCLRAEISAMENSAGGSIVNMSSIGGLRGSSGLGAYQATKHAVTGMTRTTAHDHGASGIRVNAVAPGATESPMLDDWRARDADAVEGRIQRIPLRRAAHGEDIGEVVAFLLADASAYLNGVVIPVDGGYNA